MLFCFCCVLCCSLFLFCFVLVCFVFVLIILHSYTNAKKMFFFFDGFSRLNSQVGLQKLLYLPHHHHHYLLQHVPEGDGGRDGGSNVFAELTRCTKNMMIATYDKQICHVAEELQLFRKNIKVNIL